MGRRGISSSSLVAFNAGELSPKLNSRIDLEKFRFGCRQLQNAVVSPYGSYVRRAGFQHVAAAKHPDRICDLVDFQFSRTTTFVLEVGHEYIRFFSNGTQVLDGSVPYEISSPWQESEVRELHYTQINDVVYIAHPSHSPRKLSRISDTDWILEEVEFDTPALMAENLGSVTISSSATTGATTLTASGAGNDIFDPLHVGSYWQISHKRDADSVELDLSANGNSSNLSILGDWNMRSYGFWSGDLLVQKSTDGGSTWDTVRKFKSSDDRNVDAEGSQSDASALYRVKFENQPSGWTKPSGADDPRAVLENRDSIVGGLVKITAVGSGGTSASGTVIEELQSTLATQLWSEGAWSDYRGWPAAVTVFEQRIIYGRDQTIWGSVTGDYENFKYGVNDADAFSYTLGSQEFNSIEWLIGEKGILIGTTGGEWSISSGSQGSALTPTNAKADRHSSYGSNSLQSKLVGDVVLFVQRKGRKVREFVYTFERDKYVAPDLTLLSEHITEGGIVDFAYQQQPDSTLWAVTGNGNLIGMTYERDQNVVGWHRHTTQGTFESVATIYGSGNDELWCVVNRTVGGSAVRYIERLNPNEWTNKDDMFYVDSGVTYSGSATTTVSGLDHLEGMTVAVLADGAVVSDKTVSGGAITLVDSASVVHAGLSFETIWEPMQLDVDAQSGNTQAQTKRIRAVSIRFIDSLGCQYGDGTNFDQLPFRDTSHPMDASPPLFTGYKEFTYNSDYSVEPRIVVKQTQPLPTTVIGAVPKYQVTGRK